MVTVALLLDFDGTAYVSDLPVQSYARHAAEQLSVTAGTGLVAAVRAFLEQRTDILGDPRLDLSTADDGYRAVELAGSAFGLDAATLSAAYRASRRDLAASAFAVEPAEGLIELLAELAGTALTVLVTNSDPDGVIQVLEATGLAPLIDCVITDAGKPQSLPGIASRALQQAGVGPQQLISIGDRWTIDLAPVAAIGGATAYLDRYGRGDGSPTFRGPDLGSMIGDIGSWARQRSAALA